MTTSGQRINFMRSNTRKRLRIVSALISGLLLLTAMASAQPGSSSKDATKTPAKTTDQNPTSATIGEDAGHYTITSSIEFGYRGIRVDGDERKYRSDLNYKAGPRLFDTSFLMQAKDGK